MKNALLLIGSMIFGFGLALSGMVQPEIVLSFLYLQDLGLLLVMGGGIAVAALGFYLVRRYNKKPVSGKQFETYTLDLSKKAIVGAVFFGIGWGIAGVCPGSTIAAIGAGNIELLFSVAGMFVGAYVDRLVKK